MRIHISSLISFVISLCIAAIPHTTWSWQLSSPARRCWTSETSSTSGTHHHQIKSAALWDDLAQSTCQRCDPFRHVQTTLLRTTTTSHTADNNTNDTTTNDNATHVGVMLPSIKGVSFAEEPYLIITAALLMRGISVTLFSSKCHHLTDDTTAVLDVREFILQHVPCDAQLQVSNLLRIECIPLPHASYPCDEITYDKKSSRIRCAILQEAEWGWAFALRSSLQMHSVRVLLLDAGMIAAQLAAQSLGISVVALLDPDLYDDLLVRRWVRHSRPQSLFSRIKQRFVDLWEEIEWVSSFTNIHRICRRLGLPVPFTITDIWESVDLVVTKPLQTKSSRVSIIEGPLLAPCMPCIDDFSQIHNYNSFKSRAVVHLKGSSANQQKLRRDILKAFWMVRDSLDQWKESCHPGGCPQNLTDLYDFGVAWVGDTQPRHYRGVASDFVASFGTETTLLQALGSILSNEEHVLLIVVDDQALQDSPWIHDLGPPVIYVNAGMSVRELAVEMIRNVHRIHVPRKSRLATDQALQPILAALRGKTHHEMFQLQLSEYRRHEEEHNEAIWFMWCWFEMCCLYAIAISMWDFYKNGESLEFISDTILKQFRLADLKNIGRQWKDWLYQQWRGEVKPPTQHVVNTTTVSHRRRKAHKKKQS